MLILSLTNKSFFNSEIDLTISVEDLFVNILPLFLIFIFFFLKPLTEWAENPLFFGILFVEKIGVILSRILEVPPPFPPLFTFKFIFDVIIYLCSSFLLIPKFFLIFLLKLFFFLSFNLSTEKKLLLL